MHKSFSERLYMWSKSFGVFTPYVGLFIATCIRLYFAYNFNDLVLFESGYALIRFLSLIFCAIVYIFNKKVMNKSVNTFVHFYLLIFLGYLILYALILPPTPLVTILLSFLAASSLTMLELLWAEIIVRSRTSNIFLVYILSFAIAAVCNLALSYTLPLFNFILFVLFTFISFILSNNSSPDKVFDINLALNKISRNTLLFCMGYLLIFALSVGAFTAFINTSNNIVFGNYYAIVIAGVILIFFNVLVKQQKNLLLSFIPATILAIIGVLLSAANQSELNFIAQLLMVASYFIASISIRYIVSNDSMASGYSVGFYLSLILAANIVFKHLSSSLSLQLAANISVLEAFIVLSSIVLLLYSLISLFFVKINEQNFHNTINEKHDSTHINNDYEDLLTAREQEILKLLLTGRTRAMIAQELSLSENTVRNHISNMYRKLNITTKEELISMFNN